MPVRKWAEGQGSPGEPSDCEYKINLLLSEGEREGWKAGPVEES